MLFKATVQILSLFIGSAIKEINKNEFQLWIKFKSTLLVGESHIINTKLKDIHS